MFATQFSFGFTSDHDNIPVPLDNHLYEAIVSYSSICDTCMWHCIYVSTCVTLVQNGTERTLNYTSWRWNTFVSNLPVSYSWLSLGPWSGY